MPLALVEVVKFSSNIMLAELIPVTPPAMLAAPTPGIITGLDWESKKLLVFVTVLVPINAPVVAAAPVTTPEA